MGGPGRGIACTEGKCWEISKGGNKYVIQDREAAAGPATPTSTPGRRPLLGLIIPIYNEEDSIPQLEKEVNEVFATLDCDGEFIVVDNASTDRTRELITDLCNRDKRWKYLRFSRNFTVEMSITAGYMVSRADAMIVLYSDLQDPPQVIPRFVEKWREGYDVVYGVRTVRPGDPAWRNMLVKLFYRVISRASDVPIPTDTGDFRLVTRPVRDAFLECGESNRYMRGLIAWLGFRQTGIVYERREREKGVSKGPFWLLIVLAMNAITSFSMKPLRLFSVFGTFMLFATMIATAVYVGLWAKGNTVPGLTTINLLLLGSIAVNSLGIGILGEYVGRIYVEAKMRPLFIIQETVNLPGAEGPYTRGAIARSGFEEARLG